MDFVKKQPGFLYLDKNGFYFFEEGLNSVISLAFLATSVRDMDVINGSALMNQIKSFIEQYKLPPSDFSVILSPNITFEKEITGISNDTAKEEVEKFVDTVPFESVIFKEYQIEKGVKIIASNDDLFRELKIGFEKFAFSVNSVIPYQMLGSDQSYIRSLTVENASQFLKRIDHLKQFTMIKNEKEHTQAIQNNNEAKTQKVSKKVNVRLFAMIGIFAFLFIILGIMILGM